MQEPFAVLDTYATGLGRAELVNGGSIRLTFYVEQRNGMGEIERIVVAKIVRPLEGIGLSCEMVRQMLLTKSVMTDCPDAMTLAH